MKSKSKSRYRDALCETFKIITYFITSADSCQRRLSSDLLYEVDHASLGVGHLPVVGQRLQAVIARKRAPRTEVHGAAGLVVAGHGFPPLRPLFVLWRQGGKRGLEVRTE